MRRWPILALLALAASLAALVAREVTTETSTPDPAPQVTAAPASGRVAGPSGPSADQVASLLARPLFSPGRRPDAEARAPDVAARATPLPRLAGIMVTDGTRQAIFAPDAAGKAIVVGEGDTIGGFRVQAIHAGEVTLQDGATLHSVQPRYAAAGSPAASGAPASAALPFKSDPAPTGLAILNNAQPVATRSPNRPALGVSR